MRPETMSAPTPWTMLEIFGVDPVEADHEEGYFAYEWRDATGTTLRLSWHLIARSVQVAVSSGGRAIVQLCHEGATRLEPDPHFPGTLLAEFQYAGAKGALHITVSPEVRATCSVLQA